MSSAVHSTNHISEQDYLEGEKVSEVRHEYIDGQIHAMADSSKHHNRISGNLYRAFMSGNNDDCEAYLSDIKVRIAQRKSYYYPDVVVSCEDDNVDNYYLEKPCLIVEVLSKSTEQKDRTEKLLSYMNIPSLRAYLMVSQDHIHIEMFYREPGEQWWVKTFEEADQSIDLPCPEIDLTVSQVYERISF